MLLSSPPCSPPAAKQLWPTPFRPTQRHPPQPTTPGQPMQMVNERLLQPNAQEKGWLLDGYPRSNSHAVALETLGIRPDIFILLDFTAHGKWGVMLHAVCQGAVHWAKLRWRSSQIPGVVPLHELHRAGVLEKDDDMERAHSLAASAGDTEIGDNLDEYYVSFRALGGTLYELDEMKGGPIKHGSSSPESLLQYSRCWTLGDGFQVVEASVMEADLAGRWSRGVVEKEHDHGAA